MHNWLAALKHSPVAHLNKHLIGAKELPPGKKKYNNTIVEFDGYIFRSKRELGRYVALRALQTAGEISDLQLQVPFQLNEGGTHSLTYVVDFLYKDNKTGEIIADDAKGKETNLFKKKAKLMFKLYGITVKKS